MDIVSRLAEELKLNRKHIENVIQMIDAGDTIPFIARYRKEQTGEMTDVMLRDLNNRLQYLRNLEAKKEEVIRLIGEQEKLTPELEKEILNSDTLQRVDDLYRPFRPKRRTRATMAKEKGLQPLAKEIVLQAMNRDQLIALAETFVDDEKEVPDWETAVQGAMDILAEDVADDPDFRRSVKNYLWRNALLVTQATDKEADSVYEMYYDFKEPVNKILNHRILAINRGEKEKVLKASLFIEGDDGVKIIKDRLLKNPPGPCTEYVDAAVQDGYKRLLYPSVEREIRNDLTERAEDEAIKVFALNLEPLLMQAPIKGKTVLAIDPGFRTGCKVAVVDDTGKLLDNTTVFPTEPQKKIEATKKTLAALIEKHNVELISIGNGTGSRETEAVVAELIKEIPQKVAYAIVNEAGASVYSASEVGLKDFPDHDVTVRGAASIGRRLQDPLAELVKIDPKHIGVGQYQHDLNQGKLDDALTAVVEDSVNRVGVDLNTASPSLLKYVSGISTKVANSVVTHREENGRFSERKELLTVKGLGEKTYKLCAGFLRIPGGTNPLDNTGVHPESYRIAKKLMDKNLDTINLKEISTEMEVGLPTLEDIVKELKKPGRDPRDEMPKPLLREDILKLEDLSSDMVLNGTVRNVVDFGAFVDIGVKQDGLVHISELANKFIKHPKEIVKVGDIVKVRIIKVDKDKGRISLSMKNIIG
ncbi:MAG: Tex family protein [Bacillota bacterium]